MLNVSFKCKICNSSSQHKIREWFYPSVETLWGDHTLKKRFYGYITLHVRCTLRNKLHLILRKKENFTRSRLNMKKYTTSPYFIKNIYAKNALNFTQYAKLY